VVFIEEVKSGSTMDANFAGNNVKAVRDDGCSFFFNTTDKGNEYLGYQVGKTSFKLTEPILKTQYPQKYNTQFSGKYSGIVTVEGSDRTIQIEGYYSTHADATGTIILPGNISAPALRVRTTEGTDSYELVKYLWYTQDDKYPVFVTMEDYAIDKDVRTLKKTSSFLNTQAKSPTGLKNFTGGALAYQVFPNPFINEIQLSYSLPEKTNVTIELYSSTGTRLTTLLANKQQSGNNSISQNVAKYTSVPGVYLLKIQLGNKIYTEKLVKAH
jgi:hypothetical protein